VTAVGGGAVTSCLSFFGLGLVSAFLPFVNAEAAAVGAAAKESQGWFVLVVVLALGQTLGKVLIFVGVRRGGRWTSRWTHGRAPAAVDTVEVEARRWRRWRRALRALTVAMVASIERPVIGPLVFFASALVGIPPLLGVAVVAGASKASLPVFTTAVVVGRVGRFSLIALPVATALNS
jgi:membrane protein YqaA with SNARE-associated domain